MLEAGKLARLIQELEKGSDAARRQAIHSLKELTEDDWAAASAKVVNSVLAALKPQLTAEIRQPLVRQEAVAILDHMGPRAAPAVPELMQVLQDGNPDGIREAAAVALGKIGREAKPAAPDLIRLLTHSKMSLANQAIRALGNIGFAGEPVKTALTDLWMSSALSQSTLIQVATTLCKLKIDARMLVRFLTGTLMTNPDAALRKAATEALALCNKNDLDVVPALLTATLNDKDEDVRRMAEASLTHLRLTREGAVQVCAKQLKDSAYAENALRRSGVMAVSALVEALGSVEPEAREKAARTLGFLGEVAVDAVPALTKAIRDKNLDFRLAAAKSLWNITKNADVVTPVLIKLLSEDKATGPDGAENRRRFLQTVIEALWRIGPPAKAAVPALTAKTKDKNRLIAESAINALKEIAPGGTGKSGS